MPFGSEGVQDGIGLALSGGGFRASLFHLGSLWRLNETGFLRTIDRISSVSGGSITAGLLGVRWQQLSFTEARATNFRELIVEPLREFCGREIDVPAVGLGALLASKRASDLVEEAYREHLYGDADLQALPTHPRFVFNATNCATGVCFRFSRPYAGDYLVGMIPEPKFRISQAVAASSAFPPVLSPAVIDVGDPALFQRWEGADLYDNEAYRRRLLLTDGGVYDNLGLESVWKRCRTILASDAGAPFDRVDSTGTGWIDQAKRSLDIATNQALSLRRRAFVYDLKEKGRSGALWSIDTDIAKFTAPGKLACRPELRDQLAGMRTRLNRFSEKEQCRLINWGYALCDAALRTYVDQTLQPPAGWPYPAFGLD